MMRASLLGLAAAAFLAGCGNPCQQLCRELLNYAEECNLDISDEDLAECRVLQARPSPEDLDACEWGLERVEDPNGDRPIARVRVEWTCEEMRTNVLGGSASDDDSVQDQ
jgi:hypothetical protein